MRIVTASAMRELDRKTIEEVGIPGVVLMENAGRGATNILLRSFPVTQEAPVAVICGGGNNGGDGFVMARLLHEQGIPAQVFLLAAAERISGDAKIHFDVLEKLRVPVQSLAEIGITAKVRRDWKGASCVVDAIFGTGLAREVGGIYRDAIRGIVASGRPVLAVDIPSGIDADTGKILGIAVRADCTATFGLPKRGLYIHPGADHAGRIECVDIGVPHRLVEALTLREETIEARPFRAHLHRKPDTHKGSYGHLFVLAGSAGKTGAACLAAEAALRCGAGLVTVGIPESLNPILEGKLTEAMTLPLPGSDDDPGTLSAKALGAILTAQGSMSGLVVGPGLGTGDEVERLVRELWTQVEKPMVWDADGLNLLARNPDLKGRNRGRIIITPHPGEMGRLIGKPARYVQENRLDVAKGFAQEWGVVTVLKGCRTLVADPEGRLGINLTGNAGMAAGGMGDVLSGMLGGFLVQGMDLYDAACFGVFVHGAAGDLVAGRLGPVGFLAGELMQAIPEILRGVIAKG